MCKYCKFVATAQMCGKHFYGDVKDLQSCSILSLCSLHRCLNFDIINNKKMRKLKLPTVYTHTVSCGATNIANLEMCSCPNTF